MKPEANRQYADLLTPPVNYAVVQLPERKFPGVVVQGDSLFSMVRDLNEMKRCLDARDFDELAANIDNLADTLKRALAQYESVCAARKIDLPYVR